MRALTWIAIVIVCFSCRTRPANTPDPGCELSCKHLTELACEEGGPLCVERCSEYQQAGLEQHNACMATVESCEETVACALE